MTSCFACITGLASAGAVGTWASQRIAGGDKEAPNSDVHPKVTERDCQAASGIDIKHQNASAASVSLDPVVGDGSNEQIPETEEELLELTRRKALKRLGGDATKALFEAVQMGDTGMAADAIDLGADMSKTFGSRSITSLHLAAQMENPDLISLLVSQTACPLNARTRDSDTALMKSVKAGCKAATGFLVDARADINAARPDGATALSIAKACGRQDFADFLVAEGATG